jgi:hypothetical protein
MYRWLWVVAVIGCGNKSAEAPVEKKQDAAAEPVAAPPEEPPSVSKCDLPGLHANGYGFTLSDKDDGVPSAWLRDAVVAACKAQKWTDAVAQCFSYVGIEGDPGKPIATCLAMLRPEDAKSLEADIAKLNARADAIMKAPPSCNNVAASYYSDARWKDVAMPRIAANQRAAAITASRDLMKQACKDWSPIFAQCVMDAKTEDETNYCFDHVDSWSNYRWTYPASGIAIPTGVAECDAWNKLVKKKGCTVEGNSALIQLQGERARLFALPRGHADEQTHRDNCKQHLVAAAEFGCTL